MPLFKRKPDAMSLTMSLVEAYARGNHDVIEHARQGLAPVATIEILESLYRLGQFLNRVPLTAEQSTAIEAEIGVTTGTPEMAAAVQNVARAILIERTQPAFVAAINTYTPPLLGSTSDQLRQMAILLAALTGSVCRRIEMRFNWK